ncbi:MAG: hypothetical protein QOI36_4863, partial [Pseudonocardiales bacterium]|nr:hypothetical protein [Pseudonocardiales bacterium]
RKDDLATTLGHVMVLATRFGNTCRVLYV